MNLCDIARQLGGELGRNGYITCPGPGHSPKDRSLSVWLNHDGKLRIHSFAGDDWALCMDDVRARLGLPAWDPGKDQKRTSTLTSKRPSDDRDEASRIAACRRLWREGKDPRAAPVFAYLKHRGLPPLSDDQLPIFRFHGSCPFSGSRVPALIARFSPSENDPGLNVEPTAILRVRLDRYHGDRRKLALGPSRGQVIKLSTDISLAGLGITEGIEKGLALIASGWRPIWATSGTSAMRTFPVLPAMECLTIFCDADAAGRDAALAAVARWHDAGREARILAPPPPHKDWDSYVVGGRPS